MADSSPASPDAELTHDLIICTRNRAHDLTKALESITSQTLAPHSVIVVDSSDDTASRDVTLAWEKRAASGTRVQWSSARPGLPAQRNVGVAISEADVLHFIDDDVELEANYLAAIDATYRDARWSNAAGVGGYITNAPSHRPRLWWRMALMDSKREGVVLPSGVNVMVATEPPDAVEVFWLSGCSMSFKRHVFDENAFDESLEGYALMEDADFGVRAARVGRLVLQPRARLVHHVSPSQRWDHASRHRASVYRRGWFVSKNLAPSSRLAFWWSVIAGFVVQCAVGLGKQSRYDVRVAVWRVLGGVDFLRGKR